MQLNKIDNKVKTIIEKLRVDNGVERTASP